MFIYCSHPRTLTEAELEGVRNYVKAISEAKELSTKDSVLNEQNLKKLETAQDPE